MNGIPPGKHVVEVWHPEYEPIKRIYEVEILHDQVTELPVQFKVPPVLKTGPLPFPGTTITNWAFVGPFDTADEEAQKEIQKLDFKAAYEGIDDDIRWQPMKANAAGHYIGMTYFQGALKPNTEAMCYLATTLNSPKAQRVVFRMWANGITVKMWLNKKMIHRTMGSRELGLGWHLDKSVIVTADLNPGRNTLLIGGVTDRVRDSTGVFVKYLAEGVTASAPKLK